MGRKNRRWKHKKPLPPCTTEPAPPKIRSRCAYCGRLLGSCEYHYVYDEFGQRVRKCNDEAYCQAHRKEQAEEAYIEAVKRNREMHKRK